MHCCLSKPRAISLFTLSLPSSPASLHAPLQKLFLRAMAASLKTFDSHEISLQRVRARTARSGLTAQRSAHGRHCSSTPADERLQTHWMQGQALERAGRPAVEAAPWAQAQAPVTRQAQRLHAQLQLLRQPQLHQRASVHHQMPPVQAQHPNLSLQAHRSV